jgi:tRNA pseudouridine38-40 synthase
LRYFFRVEYDGSRFGGWQRQPDVQSIQEHLERAFSIVLRTEVSVTGAGRTDAGVHARRQGAHFDFEGLIDCDRCQLSVNALLPPEIAVFNFQRVEPNFHARFSAVSRLYRYHICFQKRPLRFGQVWKLRYRVDWEKVRANIPALMGERDFAAFMASGSGSKNSVCSVKRASLENEGDILVFTIEANRFIYKMVRSIVGTLVDIGRGRLEATMEKIIASRDRSLAGETAPPFGLVLENVMYPGVD